MFVEVLTEFKIHCPMKKNYLQTKNKLLLELFFSKKYILLLATLVLFVPDFLIAKQRLFIKQKTFRLNQSKFTFFLMILAILALPNFSNGQETLFQFNFENAITPNIDNVIGVPTYTPNGVAGGGYQTSGPCQGLRMYTADSWNTSDYYRFTVNTTGFANMTFSFCNRTDDIAIGTFIVRVSADNGGSWTTVLPTYTPTTVNSTLVTATFPTVANNDAAVWIEIYKTNNANHNNRDYIIDAAILTGYQIPTITSFTPTSGCIGDDVEITGTNFTGATNVIFFNGISSTPTVDSATQITVTVPAGSSSGPITVVTPGGTTTSASNFTANPLPIVSAPSSVCAGSTIQLTPNSGGTWVSNDTSKATVDSLTGEVTGVASGSVTFTFTDSTTNCNKTTNTVTVLTLPAITAQPAITQTVCSGSSVSFSVTATGTGISYQWFKGATQINNGGVVSGATSATLTINPVGVADAAANYNCVVSGTCTPSVTSNDAALVVNQVVAITTQPAVTQTVCAGASASFSVVASGTGLTYQWFKGATQINNGGSVSGATSDTLTISPIALGDAAATYRCVVSGTSPCTAVTSNNATLVVNQLPAITAHPAISQTVCSGSSVSLSVTATGTGISYQWFKGATQINNVGAFSGATSATLTINPVGVADAAANYNCVVSGACTPSVTSNDAALVVNQVVAITTQPAVTQTVCAGASASFSVVATGTGLTYQWFKGATQINNGGSVSGATTDTLTISPIVLGDAAATYRCVVSGTSPCTAVTSNNATLVVNQLPAITTHPAITQTVCSGSSVSFSVTATGTGISYQWFKGATQINNGGAFSGATSATLTINPVGVADAAANYNCVVSGTCTPSVTSNDAALVVDTLTIGGTVIFTHTANSNGALVPLASPSSTYTDCHLSAGTIALSGQSGNVVRWESSTDSGNTWLNLGGAGTTTFNYINAVTTTIFRAVVQNGTCSVSYSASVILFVTPNIKPSPVSATPSTICAGESSVLTSAATYSSSQNIQSGGLFNNANPVGWTVDGSGIFSASGDNENSNTFKETNGNASTEYDTTTNDKFAIVRGNRNSVMQTPIFDLFGLSTANLTFNHAHKLSPGAWAKVELSFDGGATYTVTLATYTGNQGPYNQFNTAISINLNAYLGMSNLRIRFNYHGLLDKATGIAGDAWVIDSVNIPQAPIPNLSSVWQNLNTNEIISVSNTTNASVTPSNTTTYAVTSFLNGCTSYGPEGTTYVTVTVNQLPIVTASSPTVCSGDVSSIPLSSAVVGTQTSTTFAWSVAQTDATGASAGSGSAINQTLTATGMVQGLVTYTITPTANGCIGPARTIEARVNPRPKADIQPSQTICYGGTATFSVALEGTGPWNLTYSNGVSTTTVNGITSSPYIFSVSGMTVNRTFTITALSDTRCSARSQDLTGAAVVTVLNGTPGLWTGLVSTDWFDCRNWAGGLPSSTIDAQIPTITIAGRMPVIDRTSPFAAAYSFIATARDLLIANSASVTMVNTNNSELQISRDWKNNGSFSPGTGTVTFVGATLNQIHTINVGIKTNEGFYNLTTNTTNGAIGISLVDGFELTVANELSLLSGDIRLTGSAQLVQSGTTANPSTGTGKILIDQQGLKISYNYNYWSSPVTPSGTNYTVGGVLRDGTDSATNPFNPSTINFGGGYYFADGVLTSPIKISTSWIYKYTSVSIVYAGWQHIGSAGTVNPGEGFTMKGPTGVAPFTTPQNYVFVGKPNNGNINLSIALNQSYLVGNPYPCALDADEFIKDNIKDGAGRATSNVFNGALYFWDHFGGQSHILNQYIGGYATYTLMGGVVAVSNDPLINANGSFGSRSPKRHIPVGQGFFIGTGSNAALTSNNPNLSTPITGGTVAFKNSQRAFKTESAANSVFFRNASANQTVNSENDSRQKIRIQYTSSTNMNRQILVGADELTTDLYDIGYDAAITDLNPEDMYWNNSNAKLVIQAVPDFNEERIIPIGLKTTVEGLNKIKIASLENITETTELYIYDNQTNIYTNIRNGEFSIFLLAGDYPNRFSLRFAAQTLGVSTTPTVKPIVYFTNSNNTLNINNNSIDKTVTAVSLFNILGQHIKDYPVGNANQQDIQIPFNNLASGTYIAKVITDAGNFSEKIIVK
jgi:hypothetical protein